jgi:hypothetical protein
MPRIEASAPPMARAIKPAPRKEMRAEPPRHDVAVREKPAPKPEPKVELYAPARGARRG